MNGWCGKSCDRVWSLWIKCQCSRIIFVIPGRSVLKGIMKGKCAALVIGGGLGRSSWLCVCEVALLKAVVIVECA